MTAGTLERNDLNGSDQSLLVVSTGRTGTASIADNFRTHYSRIRAVHEPFGSRVLRITGNLYASGSIGFFPAALALRSTYGVRRKLYGNDTYIESNPHACCLIPLISRLYPDTIILHVVRHPLDFVRSYVNHGAFSGLKGLAGNRLPYWFLRPEHVYNTEWPAWSEMDPLEASAWRWSILNRIIERDCHQSANHSLVVRYEDLFQDGYAEWIRIASACALDTSPWKSDNTLVRSNVSMLSVADMSEQAIDRLKRILEERCSDQLERYGYQL